MLAKANLKTIAKFALLFAAVYAVLIFPWPGFEQAYGQYFRAFGAMIFTHAEGKQTVSFAPSISPAAPNLDTEIVLGNRDAGETGGKSVHVKTDIDSRSIGWVPTALTMALIAATPITLRRRLWAMAGGLALVHAFILLTVQSWIWNNAPTVGLVSFSDLGKQIADALNYSLVDQLGASFSVPVLIWVMVTFRRQDSPQALE